MGEQLGGNGFREIARTITNQYIESTSYVMKEEVEYLLDSAEVSCDEFLRACRTVFGTRYNAIFLSAQNTCCKEILWLLDHSENPDGMSESDILDNLEMCNEEESTVALCVYALKQNNYTPIEPVLRKSHKISEYANRFCQSLDPDNKLRSYLAYMRRDHAVDDEIYYLHSECAWPFWEIGIKLGLSPQAVEERYLIAERVRL